METAKRVAFYLSLGFGIPIIVLSYRCVFILRQPARWKNAFCRIFVAILIVNSVVYTLLMVALRIPGMGWFPSLYASIAKEPWLPYFSYVIRIFLQLAMMLSLTLSLNRVTTLYLNVIVNEKIWARFIYIHLPLMVVACALLVLETAINRADYTAQKNSAGETYYTFNNYNITVNVDMYWMTVENGLDLAANILVLLRFVRLRMNSVKRTVSETSLYLVSFCNFIFRAGSTAIQLSLRYNMVPASSKPLVYLFSNAFADATVLLPTVFILALTKEIRQAFKRTILRIVVMRFLILLLLSLFVVANALRCPTGIFPAGEQPSLPEVKCRVKPFCYTWTYEGSTRAGCDESQMCSKVGCTQIAATTLCCTAP